MLEHFGTIRNPLTIIAIFAGIAEISGTAILPFVSPENQASYIEFLKLFPPFLVLLFFATLNFNHRVLYAPSDYKDENNFFKRIGFASRDELNRKIEDDILDEVEEQSSQQSGVNAATTDTDEASTQDSASIVKESVADQTPQKVRLVTNKSTEDVRARYIKAEKLLFEKLSLENTSMLKGVGISDSLGRRNVFFDGLIMDDSKVQAIEFLYFSNGPFNNSRVQSRIRKTLDHAFIAFKQIPESQQKLFSLLIAIATDGPLDLGLESGRLRRLTSSVPFPVRVQVYKLSDLEKEMI
ncbi:MAG: hypothetical protein A3J49_00610 [Gallionellales bacterium RIFCSPHIGHO2_02_FULL_57_16]|nr:MAG: hypothetical protein A3J49_00610 [Gallionellales bacterium RIFCSPHIGHO2_02_FULL_57_16]